MYIDVRHPSVDSNEILPLEYDELETAVNQGYVNEYTEVQEDGWIELVYVATKSGWEYLKNLLVGETLDDAREYDALFSEFHRLQYGDLVA